jgi:YegS/Rv2252/BmrU family lipid kinase
MKILLVFNPHAAHGRAKSMLPAVLGAFSEARVDVNVRTTTEPGHATRLVAEAAFGDYDGVVAAGGDGTLFEVLNGYYLNSSPRRIALGVLPVGTGNAFARDLDLGTNGWHEAVKVIAASRSRRFDVGRFTVAGRALYYLNILGLGFVADVVDSARHMKLLGNVSYTIGVLLRTIALRSYHIRIEADGTVVDGENIFTEVSNTRWTSNFLMAPDASIEDGLLDVTMLGRMSRRRLLSCFPLIFTGEHVTLPEVRTFKARSIRISTDAPKVLTPDGELVGATPVDIQCLPRDIEVFCR